jgi:hypothetical protein
MISKSTVGGIPPGFRSGGGFRPMRSKTPARAASSFLAPRIRPGELQSPGSGPASVTGQLAASRPPAIAARSIVLISICPSDILFTWLHAVAG